jgi:hypothetical protein
MGGFARLSNLYCNRVIEKELSQRRLKSIFDYEENAGLMPMRFVDTYPENNLYGMAEVLRAYLKIESRQMSSHSYIEHGLFLGNYVNHYCYEYSDVRNVITFGDYREGMLAKNENIKRKEINILKIGPYIHYANSFHSADEIQTYKIKYGRILLVFPSHSIPGQTVSFDIHAFVKTILDVKKELKCNSVFICLYWKDIEEKDNVEIYRQNGFYIVSAGHVNDPFFLPRLRSIIELSDVTMSNDVGTNLGYCIYLDKPHFMYVQKQDFKEGLDAILKEEKINKQTFDSILEAKNDISKEFSNPSDEITACQKEVVDYYWGLKCAQTPDCLYRMIFRE